MDGYEIARRLRSLPDSAGMRLVAVSGYGLESDRAADYRSGDSISIWSSL
jgi:CheY-like chemotaxis protein